MLSEKQNDVFEQVKLLLGEHFTGFALVVEADVVDPDDGLEATFWKGTYQGHSMAVGLLEKYRHELVYGSKRES